MKKPRVVFDTNVYISATIFPGGIPEELLKLAFAGDILLGVSKEILEELSKVYLRKFHLNSRAVYEQIKRILNNAELVEPTEKLSIVKADKSDNIVLECAVAYKAEIIVSGDFHLLEIKKYKAISILKPAEYLRLHSSEVKGNEYFTCEKHAKYLTTKVEKTKHQKRKKQYT
ncbi:MAG: putative toxin-antitoxin system toxin component, PIN family [Candidatus Firestonebacteria bacterium GWA2_43_8]|nr:MAG: putative toxin-antitoxin system toxin component, PIN family [Candidatus Firestonebacteria bacterium GWA2_43_8]